jgi:SulP family sulfate permease
MESKLAVRSWLAAYGINPFRHDLIAGLTVAAVAVPQAMAYALIAGVEPRYGLYTAIVPALLGSLFGSSRHLITGPTNAISIVVFGALAGLSLKSDAPVEIGQAVCLLALLAGGFQLLIAILKLGDLTRYVSESVILGFMVGASVLVALGQVPNLLGLHVEGNGHQSLLQRLWLTLRDGGDVNLFALALGLGTMVVAVALRIWSKRLPVRLPHTLLALIVASVVAYLYGWQQPGTELEVPRSLPAFHIPQIQPSWVRDLTGSALAIALLGLLESLAIAKSIAARTREPLDFNHECFAQGLANFGGGLFQCIPGSGSLTRSAINHQAGGVSRVAGILSALAVAGTVLLFAPLARFVPKPALAGILLVTAWRLVDRPRLLYCLKATRFDATIALSTAFVAIFLSIEFSILVGTVLSFLFFVPRAARLQASELIVSPERVLRERHPDDPQCGKLVIYSLEGELFFGAAPELDEYFAQLKKRTEQGVRVIVLRLKRTRNPDMVCLERLQHFLEDMQEHKVPVLLCGVRKDFAQALDNLGFHHWLPPDSVFLEDVTFGSATLKAVRRAYELLGSDLCPTCPRRHEQNGEKSEWYYMI